MGSLSSPIHEDGNLSRSSSTIPPHDNNNEGGKFKLRWHDFPQSVVNSFRDLKEEEDFVDVTLACNSKQFTAHKVVLSACSPYFRKLLKSNPCQHPIIILRDVVEIDVQSLLKFMYNGEVQIAEERIKDFLKTAESLQIRGLSENSIRERSSTTSISSNERNRAAVMEHEEYSPIAKRHRLNGTEQDSAMNGNRYRSESAERSDNNNTKESLLSQALEKPPLHGSHDHDDSASDNASERQDESMNEEDSKPEPSSTPQGGIFPLGLEAFYRQAGFSSPFLGGLGGGNAVPQEVSPNSNPLTSSNTPTIQNVGLQSHAANPTIGGKLDMMRVRATDPRPCPKCGKIYRSAHTLRTHMEDKHTVCPGYRCVLCGTVAKSRNSLHSHMSRQHRGISTKDLPVVPMPAPFDAELASRLFQKAGVQVTASELAARASPTAPRRSDLPKLDSNFLNAHQQHQFPLPASVSIGGPRGEGSDRGSSDAEDLRVPSSSPFGSPGGPPNLPSSQIRPPFNPKDLGAIGGSPGMGSALLDTYISMIAAAGDNNMAAAAAAAALNFHHMPAGRAATFAAAAAAAAGNMIPSNGDKDDGSDREDMAGELGSDADNDDLSDNEDGAPLHERQPNIKESVMNEDPRKPNS